MCTRFFLFCVLLFPLTLAAKAAYPYDWEKNRQRYKLSPAEEQVPEIILKDHVEYAYTFENNQFVMYCVYHRIVRVNTSEAIQRHNRISISLDKTIELTEVKARSINQRNEVVSFDKNNLKEVKEADGQEGGKIFAMEGVEIGSEIEYYFVRKMTPAVFSNAYLQMDVPIKQASFVLKCPRHLEFDFRSYNGFPDIRKDTTGTENIYSASLKDVPPSKEEAFAFHIANRKRIEFKLAYNTAKSRARLYTWDDAGKHFYTSVYVMPEKAGKALDKFVKDLRDDPSKSLPWRIRNIERRIKSTIQLDEERSDESLNEIEPILKYKVASKYGMTRLLIHSFRRLGIQAQVVLTCNREYVRFDESFDTWNYLDDYILFFPETNGFLSPYNLALSYPLVDTKYVSQKGLMIEPVEIASVQSGLAVVQNIPAPPYQHNADNLDITVNFTADMTANEVNLKRQFTGYGAMYIAPYYHLMTDQQKLSMIDGILKETAAGVAIKKWSGKTNFEGEVDQFDIDVDFTSSHFIERAGPRILFKVGLLIGPQSELYRDDKRILPIENPSNRCYERVIRVNLPKGYSIKNPDDMKFNVLYKDGDNAPFSFVTSYSIDGQVLTLKINEYYKDIFAPLERYEDFRKVINAAADFNKVILVLEKK